MNNSSVPTRSATPWGAIFSLFMALVYGASPLDLIPDLIPILGLVDDAVVVPMLLVLAFFQYRKIKRRSVASRNVIVAPPQQ